MINTTVVSTITLQVEVPSSIDCDRFDDRVVDYATEDTEGLCYSGQITVSPNDVLMNIAGYDDEDLGEFFNEVRDVLRPVADKIDRVYFYRG